MNWDAIGAVGEILGALAVFISLVYLAVQVRQNRDQVQLQALMDAIARHVSKYVEATETDEKAENFRNGLSDFLVMPINERAKFHSTMVGLTAGFGHEIEVDIDLVGVEDFNPGLGARQHAINGFHALVYARIPQAIQSV